MVRGHIADFPLALTASRHRIGSITDAIRPVDISRLVIVTNSPVCG